MIPLYIQLQTRRQILKGIRANLAFYLGRDFSNHALEFVGVDGYGLDLDFGTSSKAVTCYFRPDILFPRCETMDPGDSDETILENLDNTDPESGAASAFSDHLLWAFEHYGFEGDEELKNSFTDSSSDLYSWTGAEYKGWIVDRSLDNSKDSLALRLPTFWFERKRRFQNETRSHAITLAEVSRCNKPHPGMSEVAVLIEEIMDGMKEQKRKLKSMAKHEKLPIFHHILPRLVQVFDYRGYCRILYGYFDGQRLKVQYTKILDFSFVAVIRPTDKRFIDIVDGPRYFEMMDRFLGWAWPIVQGDTGKHMLVDSNVQVDTGF